MIIFIVAQLFFPSALAGEDANIDEDLMVSANPPQQGSGGPITITIISTFYGGCCYALYAYDVEPEIVLPKDVELVGKISPDTISKFEATAGGGAVLARFTCTVKSNSPGEYDIKAIVKTSNCGNAEGKTKITITKGCVLSTPEVFPNQPSTDRSTIVTLSAYSPIEGVSINKVSIFYLTLDGNNINDLKAENETIQINGKTEPGTEVILTPKELEENQWQGEIPKQDEEATVVYWIVAEDNFGNKTTSPINTLEVKNLDDIHFQHNMLIWGALIVSVVGVFILGNIWRYTNRVRVTKLKSEGFQLVGTDAIEMKNKGIVRNAYQTKMNRIRMVTLLILILVAVILIILAITGNQYELLRENIGG
jgi:hypothetical protein